MADLTPNEIINKEFHVTFRGYATEQVDEFLQQISDTLYRTMEENKRLRAQLEDLRGRLLQYEQTEDLMKNALMLAERTASDTRERARHEAEMLRREAEQQIAAERTVVEDLHQQRLRIISELRAVLNSHLSMLDSQEGRVIKPPTSEAK